MATVNPYLNFNGTCEAAFNFYKSAFGGEFINFSRFNEMPQEEDIPVTPDEAERILHVALPISNETVLMGSDTSVAYGGAVNAGSNISMSINANSLEEAHKLYHSLSEGGNITMPMQKTFWGAHFGMFTDKYDINWMVNFDEPEEIKS